MGLLSAFIAELAIITYRSFRELTTTKSGVEIGFLTVVWPGRLTGPPPLGRLPLPADYTGAALVYGLLGLMGKTQAEPVATALGWGFVLATLLNLWTPQHPGSLAKTAPAKTTTTAKR